MFVKDQDLLQFPRFEDFREYVNNWIDEEKYKFVKVDSLKEADAYRYTMDYTERTNTIKPLSCRACSTEEFLYFLANKNIILLKRLPRQNK